MISPEKSTNNLISQINEQVFIKNYGCTQVRPENNSDINQIKVLSKRWIILAVFSLITLLSAFNWIEYNIIQDVTIAFYNESLPKGSIEQNDAVNWFSMVYMLCYIPLVFPAMFLLDRKGLRLSILLGAGLTTLGASIKCAAVRPDLFAVAMLGQTICAIAQCFTLSVPARLSALWFGPTEIATATSIGVFANQLGSAIGFLIPPNVVLISDSIKFMQSRFYYLLVPAAFFSFISFILAFIFVQNEPVNPPSLAQFEIRDAKIKTTTGKEDIHLFKKSLLNLLKNFNFDLMLLCYGVITGIFYSISTLLNQLISEYHTNENKNIGFIGLILVASGLLGSIIGGIILDKTKAFKLSTLIFYLASFFAMVLFSVTLHLHIGVTFGTSFLLGFFMTGYLPVGFELAVEITYPEPESTSCGLLNVSAQVFGIFYTYIQGRIASMHGALYGNIFVSVSLLLGSILTYCIRSDFRRQKTLKKINNDAVSKF